MLFRSNDHAWIDIEGHLVPVEQSTPALPIITLEATDTSASETATGIAPNPGRFTLTRTGDSTKALSVSYILTGSAAKGSDYADLSGTAVFAAGAATTFVDIQPIDDSLAEGNETVILTLAAGTNYSLGSSIRGVVTIADHDNPVISVAATDAEAGETSYGATPNPGRFTLTRTGDQSKTLAVSYNLSGTASKGSDYVNLPGTAVFAAGSATAVVDVRPLDDTLPEGNETVVLSLAAGKGYSLGSSKSTAITIVDNEPSITVTATDALAGETAPGTPANPGRFSLTRTGDRTKVLTVAYTLSGTATKGSDYLNLTGTVSFAAGSATAFVDVNPIDDNLAEGSETVILTLATGTGYSLGTSKSATITLADNEKPVITIAATDPEAAETADGAATDPGRFTLSRIGDLSTALTVNYAVSGTATLGKDYRSLPGRATFSIGSSTALVTIEALDDLLFEDNETVILTIASSPTYGLGTLTSSTVVIKNTNPRGLADFLWDKGTTLDNIALNLKSRGFSLSTVTDSLRWGIGKINNTNPSFTDVAVALWSTEIVNDPRMLADLLWDTGASQQQIGQAMKYLGFTLETIAGSVKRGVTKSDGTGLNNIDVALAVWNSGYGAADGLNSYKLADLLWENGASPIEIGQALKYLGMSLEAIADAVKWGVTKADGTNLEYHQVAESLWNSGYTGTDGLNSRKLADLLWDRGASQQKIGQAFEYLKLNLETIADAILNGVTQSDGKGLNHIDAALSLWNSGYGIDSRRLADLLWDAGVNEQKIGQAFK